MLGGIHCHRHINAHALSKKWNEKILCSAEQRSKDSVTFAHCLQWDTSLTSPQSAQPKHADLASSVLFPLPLLKLQHP